MVWEKLSLEIGAQFNNLTILKEIKGKTHHTTYLCQCTCGNETIATATALKGNRKKSCGCLVPVISQTHSLTDEKCLVGQKFSRLTVIERNFDKYSIDKHSSYYLCRCECGNEKVISRTDLTKNSTRSCGCLSKEILYKRNKSRRQDYHPEKIKKCNLCKISKKMIEFYRHHTTVSYVCKLCELKRNKDRRNKKKKNE